MRGGERGRGGKGDVETLTSSVGCGGEEGGGERERGGVMEVKKGDEARVKQEGKSER